MEDIKIKDEPLSDSDLSCQPDGHCSEPHFDNLEANSSKDLCGHSSSDIKEEPDDEFSDTCETVANEKEEITKKKIDKSISFWKLYTTNQLSTSLVWKQDLSFQPDGHCSEPRFDHLKAECAKDLSDNSSSEIKEEPDDEFSDTFETVANENEKITKKKIDKSISFWKLYTINQLSSSLVWKGGKGYHVCDKCSFTSMRKRDIYCHLASEHNEKTYVCNICSKEYMWKRSIQHHIDYAHRDVQRPYKCEHCDYSSRCKLNLETHMYHHTRMIKPHKCDHCSYRTVKKYMLKKHTETVHTNKPKIIDAVLSSMMPLI